MCGKIEGLLERSVCDAAMQIFCCFFFGVLSARDGEFVLLLDQLDLVMRETRYRKGNAIGVLGESLDVRGGPSRPGVRVKLAAEGIEELVQAYGGPIERGKIISHNHILL